MKLKYTKFQIALEIIALLLIIWMIIFICTQWNKLPDQIPAHYNAMGEPNRWGDKIEIIIAPIISILLYATITIASFFPKTWNVPVRVTDSNKEVVYRYTRNLLILIKVEVIGMFFYTTYYTATSQSLSAYSMPVLLFIILGTPIYFIIRICRIEKKKWYDNR
ncbi:DUF1648 domain-containing protein [Clostridium vincentii]|uniref:DUF1648 domain-containing protein n=1 Tax=Clostridium vincentii TaxID=52704 RepID=A0A2T0BDJ3_9CLOT|nr:DUF1648 domain-containing protein [Clostridium vincentii]PRR81877.1 hypothetical protein CLVI_22230 [Clostridium vincentii]